MKNYGKPVLLSDKITACIERSELALLEEKICALKKNQLALEGRLAQSEKICFRYLALLQKLSEEVAHLRLWRDHKLRSKK